MFKRYANPFYLFDNLIENNEFSDYISSVNSKYIEELEYDVWLHKAYNQSFNEFRDNIQLTRDAQSGYMNEEDVKTTIQNSSDILSNFTPQ